VWKPFALSLKIKLQLYSAVVEATAFLQAKRVENKLDVVHQRNLRKIIRVMWRDKVRNTEVLARTNQRLQFAGHIIRMVPERLACNVLDWIAADGMRGRGRPKKTWRSTL